MDDRVDVLAYDRYAERDERDRRRQRRISAATYVLAAVVVGYGILQAQLLLSVLGALAVVGVRFLAFGADRPVETVYRAVDAGRAEEIVRAHEVEARRRDRMRSALVVIAMGGVLAYGYLQASLVLAAIGAGVLGAVAYVTGSEPKLPRIVAADVDRERADREFELSEDETDRG